MDDDLIELRLGTWFFQKHLGPERQYGHYPWDATEKLALEMGFTAHDASRIRELQREAPNHSWSLGLWFEVGVLDPDQAAFLRELRSDPGWQQAFEDLLETDGGRV